MKGKNRKSKGCCTIITANGTITTTEEATVYVKDLDMLITVQLLVDSPAVPSLRKLCQEQRYSFKWKAKQFPTLTQYGKHIYCKSENCVPTVLPGVLVDTSPWNDASSASDRPPTASGDGARYSRLTSAIHGSTGRRRIWIIRQSWWNNHHNTSSTYSSETQTKTGFSNTVQKSSKVLYWICPERGERQEERPHASTRTKNKQIDLGIRWLCSSVVFLCVLCTMILWTSLLACLAHMFVFSWNENAHTQKTNWQTNASEPKRLLSFRPVEKKLAEVDLQASRMALLR